MKFYFSLLFFFGFAIFLGIKGSQNTQLLGGSIKKILDMGPNSDPFFLLLGFGPCLCAQGLNFPCIYWYVNYLGLSIESIEMGARPGPSQVRKYKAFIKKLSPVGWAWTMILTPGQNETTNGHNRPSPS